MIHIVIPGSPIALKRHRTTKTGHRYDPSFEDKKDFLAKCMANRPNKPIIEPVYLTAEFRFQRPKNHYRTGKYANELKDNAPYWHIGRPDIDNLLKLIMDSLNGIFWRDDSQICKIETKKIYHDTPQVRLMIETVE